MESPNTSTTTGCAGDAVVGTGWSLATLPDGVGCATTSSMPSARDASICRGSDGAAVSATTSAAATATAPDALTRATDLGRSHLPVRIGRSTATYDRLAMQTVIRQRSANSGAPSRPVRSALAAIKTGQCQRYTP